MRTKTKIRQPKKKARRAPTEMPMVCDRCGRRLSAGSHSHLGQDLARLPALVARPAANLAALAAELDRARPSDPAA